MAIYEKEELTSYHILKKIELDENISQRMLSNQMGVNVASINFALKRLVTKGLIKMIGINPRRIKYIVTPRGLKEKSELAYKFFERNFYFYKDVRIDVENKITEISNGRKKVAIYGTNELSEITYLAIQNIELELLGFFNNDRLIKITPKFLGHKVLQLNEIKDIRPHIVLFTQTKDILEIEEIVKDIDAISIDLTGYYKV